MIETLFIGLDVHKRSVSVATAEGFRGGEVSFLGDIENTPDAIARLMRRLARKGGDLEFCYEAGCCGYGVFRQITEAGHACQVVAPTRIPRAPGDVIKTDRRDAQRLAVLHRAGDLTAVWVPDPAHEAMRDLVRARQDAAMHQTRMRQQLLAFLLRHGRLYEPNRKHWTQRHRQWLGKQSFEHPAQNAVFQDYMEAVWSARDRDLALRAEIEAQLPHWSLASLVAALRCLRGIDMISATTIMAGVGDISRFDTARQFMSFLGLTPSEHSSGTSTRRGGITKMGNGEVRRMLIEAGWSYRYPARLSQDKMELLNTQPASVRSLTWTAQKRLCKRYRQLSHRGKKPTVVVTAIARELSGFVWALGQQIRPDLT